MLDKTVSVLLLQAKQPLHGKLDCLLPCRVSSA